MKNRVPPVKHDAPGMKGERGRNHYGPLRQVRNDKLVGTIEDEYGVDFGVRRDMSLRTLRKKLGTTDMKDLLRLAKRLS